jgi:hypothetical protein
MPCELRIVSESLSLKNYGTKAEEESLLKKKRQSRRNGSREDIENRSPGISEQTLHQS